MIRTFDTLFSLIVIILTLPISIVIAIAIKLSSRGTIIFTQERIGLHGETFRLYKFRSMRQERNSDDFQLTVGDDSRITGIGRIIRRLKLDELPQFINVLAGDMAIIGPRPEVPHYVSQYTPRMRKIFDYKPGLTDPASIKFQNEAELLAAVDDPGNLYLGDILPKKISLSLEYQEKRTLLTDFGVILQTVALMFGH